jgi:ABC-type uncharacterized transport system substrate-binding protein
MNLSRCWAAPARRRSVNSDSTGIGEPVVDAEAGDVDVDVAERICEACSLDAGQSLEDARGTARPELRVDVRINYRWATGDAERFHRCAEELLALAPDILLASATPSIQALREVTLTVPIVFVNVADPVGAGFVESLARPGGNATGFILSNPVSARNGWNCSKRSRLA